MKIATLKDGSRDGQLVVVSRDLGTAHYATGIAHRLQQVLDDWGFFSPQLQDLYDSLNAGRARHAFPFDPRQCLAPLPRAYQCLEGRAYLHHAARECQARGAELPEAQRRTPLLQQAASDGCAGPCDDIVAPSEAMGIDFGAGLAVVTGDVLRGSTPAQALDGIRLLMLANTVALRRLEPLERERGQGPLQSRPATAFSPVAVTLDELGSAWDQGRVHLTLQTAWNGRKVGLCDTAEGMDFDFGQLIAQACQTRHLRAGSIVCSGPVGQKDAIKGYASIAERRCIETLHDGEPATDYLQAGDTVRIDMKGRDGISLCGAIDQTVAVLADDPA
ncbi:MAG: fumarylacetoacetate hydrolase family protein [Giesbergeria sp.]|jgi:fumarylacetoacetate (FAA) hydrolase|nr:fumarylacetoacetate hydrolase family protein [Giesbergeria sp.]